MQIKQIIPTTSLPNEKEETERERIGSFHWNSKWREYFCIYSIGRDWMNSHLGGRNGERSWSLLGPLCNQAPHISLSLDSDEGGERNYKESEPRGDEGKISNDLTELPSPSLSQPSALNANQIYSPSEFLRASWNANWIYTLRRPKTLRALPCCGQWRQCGIEINTTKMHTWSIVWIRAVIFKYFILYEIKIL